MSASNQEWGPLRAEEVEKVITRNTAQLDNRDGKLMGHHPVSLPLMQFDKMAQDFNALLARKIEEEKRKARLEALEDAVKIVEAMTLGFPTVTSTETVAALRKLEAS